MLESATLKIEVDLSILVVIYVYQMEHSPI